MKPAPLSIILFIAFVDLVGFGLIIPLQAVYANRLQASGLTLGFLMGAYALMQLAFNPLLGRWSDRVGRRRVLLVSVGGSVLSHLLLGVADLTVSLPLLFIARILDGATGANIATAQAYIADVTTAENRARGMGLFGAAFGLGFVMGPALGAGLVFVGREVSGPVYGTAWPAFGAAAASLIAVVLVWRFLPETRRLAAAASVAGAKRGMPTRTAVGPLSGSPTAPAAPPSRALFGAPSLRGLKEAMAHPRLRELFSLSFCSIFAFVLLEVTFVYLCAHRFGVTEAGTGMIFAYVGILMVLVQGGLVGRLSRAFGEARLVATGPFINAAGFLMLSAIPLVVAGPLAWALLLCGCVPIALGQGLTGPNLNALISRQADEGRQGTVLGLSQGIGSLARAIAPPIGGLLYDLGPPWPYWIGAAILTLVGLFALRVRLAQQQALQRHSPARVVSRT